ncbi:MAG: hypothetical protein ABIS26_01945 [Candidatus Paceibacterota bacterium]
MGTSLNFEGPNRGNREGQRARRGTRDNIGRNIRRWTAYATAGLFLVGGGKAFKDHRENVGGLSHSTAPGLNYNPDISSRIPQNPEIISLHFRELEESLSGGKISETGMAVLKNLVNTLTLKFEVPLENDGKVSIDLPMDWAKDYINTNISDPAEAQRLFKLSNEIVSELMTQFLAGHEFMKESYRKHGDLNEEKFLKDIKKLTIKGVASAEGRKDADLRSSTQTENVRLAQKRASLVKEVLLKSGIEGIEKVPMEVLAEKSVLDDITYAAVKSIADQKNLSMTQLIMQWNKAKTEHPEMALGGEEEALYKLLEKERKVSIEIEMEGGTKEHILLPLPLLLLLIPATLAGLRGININPDFKFSFPTFKFPKIKFPKLPSIQIPDLGFIFSKGTYSKEELAVTINLFQQILGEIANQITLTKPSGIITVNDREVIDIFGFLPETMTTTVSQKLKTNKQIFGYIEALQIRGIEKVDPSIFLQAVSEVIIDSIRANAQAFIQEANDPSLTFGGRNVRRPGEMNYNENQRATNLNIVSLGTIMVKYRELAGLSKTS